MNGPRAGVAIPMKPLAQSKLRLTPLLDPRQRARLSLWMLDRVARAALGSHLAGEVTVVGGDEAVQRLCRDLGLSWQADPAAGLNGALSAIYREGCGRTWPAFLFLAADLPRLQPADVDNLLLSLQDVDMVLAAAERGGTNAIGLRCGLPFEFELGEESLRRHEDQAVRRGLAFRRVVSERLRADVDLPADLERLRQDEPTLWRQLDEGRGQLTVQTSGSSPTAVGE